MCWFLDTRNSGNALYEFASALPYVRSIVHLQRKISEVPHYFFLFFFFSFLPEVRELSQLTFTCSKSTIKILEITSFWCLCYWLWTYFTSFSGVSIVDFEWVNINWDKVRKMTKPDFWKKAPVGQEGPKCPMNDPKTRFFGFWKILYNFFIQLCYFFG